ncbi:MAG: YkgJ family cysteine cluster protein [Myxococcales bacterium]|nr:YkgJ family cysteine cluster protein [Myxococcales bacterium]
MPDVWYEKGLRFRCTRCGNCCAGAPGTVRVTDDEIEALAKQLELPIREFRKVYTRSLRNGDVSLREKSTNECIFYGAATGCSVYDRRPRQCRTWPFWRAVTDSEERWEEEAESCPGMNCGPLWSADRVKRTCEDDGTSGSIRKLAAA